MTARAWPSILFPPPSEVLRTLGRLASGGRLAPHVGATLARVLAGFALGAVPALFLGLAMGSSGSLRRTLDPFVSVLHAIPKIAILPLAIVALGIGEASKVALVATSAFFPMLLSTMAGVLEISPVHFEVARSYGLGRVGVLRRVVLPGSLPLVLIGARLALNTALLMTIAVELVSARLGLGAMIWLAWQTLRVEEMYVGLVVAGSLGLAFSLFLHRLFRLLVPWHPPVEV